MLTKMQIGEDFAIQTKGGGRIIVPNVVTEPQFNSTLAYAVDTKVWYGSTQYICTTATMEPAQGQSNLTPEEDMAHWAALPAEEMAKKSEVDALTPLLFAQYYPDGSVKSAAEFTSGIKYYAPDTTHRMITVKPFCNTGDSENDNSSLVGRVVIPPFVDGSGNGYISDDGTRFKVVGVSDGFIDANNTRLTAVVAPNTVTTIANHAFYGCTSLASVSLPAATTIESLAFYDCTSLASVSLPAATTIENNAFYDCFSLASVDFGDTPRSSVPTVGEVTFHNVPTSCKIVVPDAQYDEWIAAPNWSTLYADGYKFLRHSEWEYARKYELYGKLDKSGDTMTGPLTLKRGIAAGGDAAFYGDGIKNLDNNAVYSWPTKSSNGKIALTAGTNHEGNIAALDEDGNPTDSGIAKATVASKSDLALHPTMFDIGGGVWVFANDSEGFLVINGEVTPLTTSKTSFVEDEYSYNENLSFVFAPNVTTVGNRAFYSCLSLASISLPVATTIGNSAFANCTSLTTIDLLSFTTAQVEANASTWSIDPPSGKTVTITCSDGTFTITGD